MKQLRQKLTMVHDREEGPDEPFTVSVTVWYMGQGRLIASMLQRMTSIMVQLA